MATKYELISSIAKGAAEHVARNEADWTDYLTTAARLYKYPFNEQLLIHIQRPDATACASIDIWNEKMNCWVNKGAKGIALIDTESVRPRLKYVFDMSDVHKAKRIGRYTNLWSMKEEHQDIVLKKLERTYGETDERNLPIPTAHCCCISFRVSGSAPCSPRNCITLSSVRVTFAGFDGWMTAS